MVPPRSTNIQLKTILTRLETTAPGGATAIARSMVAEYGMSDRLGLVTYERERRPMFMPESFMSGGKTYSEEKAAEIDTEISKVMEEAHRRVRQILSDRRKILDDLARLLLEKEIVQGEELRKMLAKPEPPTLPAGEKV